MTIRPFRNADLPKLLEIWIQHYAAFGPPPAVTMAKFEQAVVARTFFRPAQLLVADDEGGVKGWIATAPDHQYDSTLVVCAFCFLPSPDDVGRELLRSAETLAKQNGCAQLQVGLVRDQHQGYAGLDPIGHGIGVSTMDERSCGLLSDAGFTSRRDVVQMIASTHGYRPPVSRDSMQFRRSTQVKSENQVYQETHQASAMSHLDIESTHLLSAAGEELATLNFWYSDPEAEVMDPAMAIIDIQAAHQRGQLTAAEKYLIGASIQSLERRRVMTVETAADVDKTELISHLETLKFHPSERGTQWAKRL